MYLLFSPFFWGGGGAGGGGGYSLFWKDPFIPDNFTGAQLRHNDFRIFADPSRIFTYNCDETFKTTSRNLSEKMPEHA